MEHLVPSLFWSYGGVGTGQLAGDPPSTARGSLGLRFLEPYALKRFFRGIGTPCLMS
jgi:hypothetical protein